MNYQEKLDKYLDYLSEIIEQEKPALMDDDGIFDERKTQYQNQIILVNQQLNKKGEKCYV